MRTRSTPPTSPSSTAGTRRRAAPRRLIAFNETANVNALRILGRPLSHGESVLDHAPPDLRSRLRGTLARCFAGESIRVERLSPEPDGRSRWLEVSLHPVSGPAGAIE